MSACLQRVAAEDGCALYGPPGPGHDWPSTLLREIGKLPHEQTARQAVEVYRELSLGSDYEEPARLKRTIAYLALVAYIFYSVLAIYQLKVAPSFVEMFENLSIPGSGYLSLYQLHWPYFFIAVTLTLGLTLLIGRRMRGLFRFETGIEQSLLVRFLMLPRIRQCYLRVIEILRFPLAEAQASPAHGPLSTHLQSVKSAGLNLPLEMQTLLELEMKRLLEACEKQLKLLSAGTALIILLAIVFFLVSAYSPLFVLGEIA